MEERLKIGKERYGHGVRSWDDTTLWGTPTDSWLEMAREEFYDGIVYLITHYIRVNELSKKQDDDNNLIIYLHDNTYLIKDEKIKRAVELLKDVSTL